MQKARKFLPVIVIIFLLAVGIWFVANFQRDVLNGSLQASGTIEAEEVRIASEIAGRVIVVAVEEGDLVAEGDHLFSLDDELLQAQRARTVAALKAAQDGVALAIAGVDAAEAALDAAQVNLDTAQTNTAAAVLPLEQGLQALNDNAEIARAKAEQEIAAANRLIRETTYLLDNYTVPSGQQKLSASDAIVATKLKLDQARKNFDPYKYEDSSNATRQDLKESLDQAQADYDAAVRRMEYETAEAQAQAALERAEDVFESLKDGPDPDQVALYQARIAAAKAQPEQMKAAVVLAETGLAQVKARLDQAVSQREQAEAELSQIDVQMKRLSVYAPLAGTVISSNIESGEFLQPGADAMIIGQLDDLKITVYLPEDRLGRIRLGLSAKVKVDSFPDQVIHCRSGTYR